MTLLHRIIAALAMALLATASLAQQPAKKAYPTDPQGRTDFNATCLPCRGFAQTLRMYEDAIAALQQERDKRSAALKVLADKLLDGRPLSDVEKDQGKVDGNALKAVLDKLDALEIERANAEKTLNACIQKYCPAPDPQRELWYNPGMPQQPFPQPPQQPQLGTPPPGLPAGTLSGDTKPIEMPAGGDAPYSATAMDEWLTPRAECPECREAESKYRYSQSNVDAANRKLEAAQHKRQAAAHAVNDPLSLLPLETARASYAEADNEAKAAEAEVNRLMSIRFNAMMDLKECNRVRCHGKPEDDPYRRWWLGDGKPAQPPTGVVPGGTAPPAPPQQQQQVAPGQPQQQEQQQEEPAPAKLDMRLGYGFTYYPPGNYPGLGTPIAPAAGPCGCDELLRLKNEADQKSGYATFKADEALSEATQAKAAYEAAVKDTSVPPRTVLEHYNAYEAWQKEGSRLMAEADDQDRLAKSYKSQYDECMKTCTAPEPPRLIVVINFGGNNPFGTNPLGGGIVVTPPGNPGAAGSLQFSSASYGGAEGGAVLITVVRTGGRSGVASVSYQTSGGNATAGADYQPVSGTLRWGDGDDSPKSFSIALTDDTEVEAVETFNVSLNTFTGASAGSPVVAVVSIADNDSTSPAPAGSLQFSSSAYATAEGAGAVTITVLRVNGSSGAVSVQYFTGPGSATAGSDYQAVNGTLQWPSGDVGARTFTVPIVDDTLTEQTETFFVTLNNPTGGATLGVPATATVSIQDNDLSTPIGPCGAVGNAWQPNAGGPYTCSGSCQPIPSSPMVSVNGDIVTISPFHAGGAATFQGCGTAINSQSSNMTFFGQGGHSGTVTRESITAFLASIRSSSGGSCEFRCTRPPPVR